MIRFGLVNNWCQYRPKLNWNDERRTATVILGGGRTLDFQPPLYGLIKLNPHADERFTV